MTLATRSLVLSVLVEGGSSLAAERAARPVWKRDAELDTLEDAAFWDLLTRMTEDLTNISR